MNEGLNKFAELFNTDAEFQEKLKAAAEAYDGEQTEEAIFNSILVPVAEEYGISASYEEYKDYINNLTQTDELDKEELMQVSGAKGGGFGAGKCYGVGIGWGIASGDGGGIICAIAGKGFTYCCIGEGDSTGDIARKQAW